jgi:hypothetical protein
MTAQSDLIVYTGGATTRKISVAQFKEGAGIDAPKDLVWSRQNKKRVPFSDMDQTVLDYLLEEHPAEFKVVKAAEAKAQDEKVGVATSNATVPPIN